MASLYILFMKKNCFIFIFIACSSFAQNFKYTGFVKVDSIYMDIDLELLHKGDSVFGFTLMNKNTTHESMSEIKGVFNNKSNIYLIKELNVINKDSIDASLSFCLMEMTLEKKKKRLSGTFVGNFKNGEVCSSGEIELGELVLIAEKIKKIEKKLNKLYKVPKIIDISETKEFKLKTTDQKITFIIWDNVKEDGDVISLFANNTTLLKNHIVKKKKEKIVFNLSEGENNIILKSEDVGKYPPNTALIELRVENSSIEFKYSLEKNEYVTFTIVKE